MRINIETTIRKMDNGPIIRFLQQAGRERNTRLPRKPALSHGISSGAALCNPYRKYCHNLYRMKKMKKK